MILPLQATKGAETPEKAVLAWEKPSLVVPGWKQQKQKLKRERGLPISL